jgi:hypothetical protein
MCDVLRVHSNVLLSLGNQEQSREACRSWQNVRLVVPSGLLPGSATRNGPMTIERIHEFCNRLGNASEIVADQDTIAVVCAGGSDVNTITDSVVLVGSFLILRRGLSVLAVVEAFQLLNQRFGHHFNLSPIGDDQLGPRVHDYWSALDRAIHINWLLPPSVDDEPVLDVEEFAHYACAANGDVHMVVPGKLFFFPSPDHGVPEGQDWADEMVGEAGTRRRFHPDYYAALFSDLGVTTVACLSRSPPATAAAFEASGLDVVDRLLELPTAGADGGAMLLALDRLLTLARAAPGAIAVYSGAGFEWSAAVGTLVTAFLIRRLGFRAAAAIAWLRMLAHWLFAPPAPPPAAAGFAALAAAVPVAAADRNDDSGAGAAAAAAAADRNDDSGFLDIGFAGAAAAAAANADPTAYLLPA